MELSDSELAIELPRLVRTERVSTVAVLKLLAELERRRLYAELGYSSLFDYCRRKLCYSEGASVRRIQAARLMQEHPELEERLISGEVSLCTIATAASTIREGKLEVRDIAGHSKREVETLVSMTKLVAPPAERVRPLAVAAEPATFPAESPPPVARRIELRVSFSEEDFNLLSQARARYSNKLGSTLSFEALIVRLAARVLQAPRVVKARGANRSRYVAQSVRHEVHTRDRGALYLCGA